MVAFSCDRRRFFRLMGVASLAQGTFWVFLSTFALELRDHSGTPQKQTESDAPADLSGLLLWLFLFFLSPSSGRVGRPAGRQIRQTRCLELPLFPQPSHISGGWVLLIRWGGAN